MNAINTSATLSLAEFKASNFCSIIGRICGVVANDKVGVNEFTPSNLPKGYQTIFGYCVDTNPEAFDLLFDPVADYEADHKWLMNIKSNRGVTPKRLPAPEGYRKLGITEVTIFPVELLQERIG